jgi:hypothetical protein
MMHVSRKSQGECERLWIPCGQYRSAGHCPQPAKVSATPCRLWRSPYTPGDQVHQFQLTFRYIWSSKNDGCRFYNHRQIRAEVYTHKSGSNLRL